MSNVNSVNNNPNIVPVTSTPSVLTPLAAPNTVNGIPVGTKQTNNDEANLIQEQESKIAITAGGLGAVGTTITSKQTLSPNAPPPNLNVITGASAVAQAPSSNPMSSAARVANNGGYI